MATEKSIPTLRYVPMQRGDYDAAQGHQTPPGQDPSEDGYFIRFVNPDGSHAGKTIWCRESELEQTLLENNDGQPLEAA